MQRVQRACALTAMLLSFSALSGCEAWNYLVVPCGETDQFDQQTNTLKNKSRLDGAWILQTIDGKPIPSQGYALPEANPLKPTKYLRSGYLYFVTTTANFSDDCKVLRSSDGTAMAHYVLTVTGSSQEKTYPGRFWAEHEERTATLGAGEYLLPIQLTVVPPVSSDNAPNTMTARATIGEFGIGFTYTLVFRR